jgi:hypothetical protein
MEVPGPMSYGMTRPRVASMFFYGIRTRLGPTATAATGRVILASPTAIPQ